MVVLQRKNEGFDEDDEQKLLFSNDWLMKIMAKEEQVDHSSFSSHAQEEWSPLSFSAGEEVEDVVEDINNSNGMMDHPENNYILRHHRPALRDLVENVEDPTAFLQNQHQHHQHQNDHSHHSHHDGSTTSTFNSDKNKNSHATTICEGMGMVMYMDGFHWTLSQQRSGVSAASSCLNLYFHQWTLTTRTHVYGAMLAIFLLAIMSEGISRLRHELQTKQRRTANATQTDRHQEERSSRRTETTDPLSSSSSTSTSHHHHRQHAIVDDNEQDDHDAASHTSSSVDGRRRRTSRHQQQRRLSVLAWAQTGLHGLHAVVGYILMLATMTFSFELFFSVILGLVVGYVFFEGDTYHHITTNPCCAFLEEEAQAQFRFYDEHASDYNVLASQATLAEQECCDDDEQP